MNTVQRIAKNIGMLMISQILGYIFGFLYAMYMARYLGVDDFGVLSFALAFAGLFGIFADLGLSTLTIREVAKDRSLAGKYLGNIALMKVILAAIVFGLIALTINILSYPEQTIKVVYLIALSIILSSFANMFNSVFQAYERMEYSSIVFILSNVLMLSGVIYAINQEFNVIGFAFIYFIASAIVLVISFLVCVYKIAKPDIEIDLNFWIVTSKEAWPFGLSGVFVTIYYMSDTVMLSLMQGNEAVGLFNAAYKLIMAILFIPSVLNMAIFPVMSKFYISSKDSLRLAYEKYFKYMFVIGIPIGIGTTLLADRIILLIFGAEYSPSVIALQILIWSSVFIFLSGAFARLLESSNRQKTITKITAINVSANIILNLILIPKFSYVGASITTTITEFSALMLGIMACSSIGYALPKKDLSSIGKVIISGLLMGIFIIYLGDLNLFVLIILSAIFYFIILYLLRGFDAEDIIIFRKTINKSSEAK